MSKKKKNTQEQQQEKKNPNLMTFKEAEEKYSRSHGIGTKGTNLLTLDQAEARYNKGEADRQARLLDQKNRASNPEYYTDYTINFWKNKNKGSYNASSPLLQSKEQLQGKKKIAQDDYIRARKKELISQGKSKEEKAKENDRIQNQLRTAGKFNQLQTNGVPYYEAPSGYMDIEPENTTTFWKNRPEDYYYENNREEYDRVLYDFLNGTGSYKQKIDNLQTDEEAEALEKELSGYWDAIKNGTISKNYDEAFAEYNRMLKEQKGDYGSEKYKKQMESYQQEIERLQRKDELEKNAPSVSAVYDPSKVETAKVEDNFLNNYARPFAIGFEYQTGDEIDKIYQKVGDPFDPIGNMLTFGNYSDSDIAKLANADPAYFMTPTQRDTFIKYYNAGMKEEAKAYYEALEPYLKFLKNDFNTHMETKMSQNEWAPVMIGARVLTNPVAGVMGTVGAVGAMLGNEEAKDPNSDLYTLTKAENTIQSARAQVWQKQAEKWFPGSEFAKNAANTLNGVVYSIADNLTAMAVGLGVSGAAGTSASSKLAEGVIQFVMSTEATASTMVEKLESGMDGTEAAWYALGSGIIEAITEKYSIEALLKPDAMDIFRTKGAFFKYIAKNTFIEGAEEVGSDWLETLYDEFLSAVNGHDSELMAEKKQLMAANPGMSEKEADKQVLLNYFQKLGTSMLSGSLSGLMLSGVTATGKRVGTYTETGKSINDKANIEEGKSGAQQLAEVGVGMEGTETQKLAKKAMETIDKGGKLSNYEAGQLATTMARENEEKYHKTIKDTLERDVRQEMMEAGVPENVAKEAAAAVANITINNGKATDEDIAAIAKDERAMKVYQSYNSNPAKRTALANNIEKETAPQRSVAEKIGDLTGKNFKGTGALAADIDSANRESDSNEEAVDNLQTRLNGIISERFANAAKTALQTTKTLQKSKTFLDDIVQIRLAAYGLRTAMPKTNLDSQTAQTLWNEAKAEFADEEKNRVVRQATVTPGKGTATYNGVSYGTGGWAQAVNGDKTLTGRQKLYMHTVAEIAKRMGMAVNFINESGVQRVTSKTGEVSEINMEDVYGSEDQATGAVTVNIAGLDNNRITHNAVVTVAHEFTHWLEQNSRNGYAALRQFVFDELRLQGTDVETELIRSINIQNTVLGAESGESLDLYGAVAEVVARASEGLFTSAEMRNRLAEQDEGLYNKVKNFVRQFVARLNAAIKGIDTSMSREARTLKEKVDEIAKLWLEGYEEALNRSEEGAEATEGERFSTARRELQETASRAAVEHPAVEVDAENSLVTVWGKNTTTAPNANVRYSVADNRTIRTLKMMADERILNDRTEMQKILSKNKINTRSGRLAEPNLMEYANVVSKADFRKLQQLQSDIDRWEQRKTEYDSIDENDPVAKYMAAWNNADMEAMQEILDQTMLSTPGVIPFKAAEWYNSDKHKYIANAIKERDPAAIALAAAEMAELVPDNAVLVPIPNRNGIVDDHTDTMLLARAISELTGRPVVNALAGVERMSRKEAKNKGVEMTAEDLGFRKTAEIPAGTIPYFVDNVVASGVTAKAAHDAFGTGITLAYAKSTRTAIEGLKRSQDEIYGKGPMQFVRPLDQRADLSMTGPTGVHYSTAQRDKNYFDNILTNHPNIDVAVINNPMTVPTKADGSIDTQNVLLNARKSNNVRSFNNNGKMEDRYYVRVPDLGFNVEIPGKGLRHNFSRKSKERANNTDNALIAQYAGDILPYAVEVNRGKAHTGTGEIEHVLVAGVRFTANGKTRDFAVRFIVDEKKGQQAELVEAEIIGTLNAIKERKAAFTALGNNARNNAKPSISIKLSKFFEDVKNGLNDTFADAVYKNAGMNRANTKFSEKLMYSTAQRDQSYKDAVNSGDMETAQRMVDEAAREAGYNTNYLYWRGDSEPYNELLTGRDQGIEYDDPDNSGNLGNGLYFTPHRSYAERFAKDGVLRKFYLKYDAADLSDKDVMEEMNRIAEDITDETGYMASDELFDELLARMDKNAIIGHGVGGFSAGADEIAVQESWQAKLADPVTYDDAGNIIPLSERFNPKTNDIRFSLKQNVEVNEDGLIAYHNIAENQMLAALRLGGFPMPSIAITRTNYANNRYGGISVVFYPGTIDPGVSKWNKVYGSDAWTPTYPTVSYKLSSKAFDRLQKRIYKLVPESVRKGLQYQAFDIENLENNVNGRRGDVTAAVGDTVLFKLAYLNDKGIKYDLPQREKALDGFDNFKNDQVIRVAEVLGEDAVREAHNGGFEYIREHEELAGQVAQILNDQWREKHKDIALKIAKMDLYDKNKFGTNRIYELMEAADRYLSQGVESVLDQYKMQDIADSLIDQEDYQAWLKEQTKDLIEKKGIRNNKDFYTNSGNRRSWDALHDEETLENVVKVMRAQTQKGEASMFSQSDLLAIGTKDFRTLEQIRKDKGRLMHITDEEMSELKTDIVNRVSELQDELKDRSEQNDFIARDRALQAIVSAVRRYKSAAGIESELRVWRGLHVTTGMGQRILDIMKDISELPTEYFEAKPMRAVGFEEIAEVILPEGTSQELIDGLNEKNIAWKYYDGTEEGRLKALNSVEGVQFSVRQQDMEVSRFMLGLNENNMTTAQEKTMVRQFKELDAALRIERHALNDRTRRLRELEAKQNPTAFEREEMRKLRNRIGINTTKIDRLEGQMIKATTDEGYARLMYQQEQNMRNTVSGRTSEEVRATIEALTKQVAAVTKEIETRQKDIDSMRDDMTFRKTSALVDSSAAEKVAAMIRKMYNSRINKQDLIRAMTEIRLKIAAGKNIDAEAEELAWKILSEATMDGGESLKRLRGTVIKLGKGQVKELLGSNSSLKELRSIFAGSGIQVRSAKDGEVGLDGGSWEELCNIAPELDRNATELEQVNELIRFVQNQKQQMSGAEQYRDNIDEVVMDLKGWIASIGVNTPQDPGAMKILDSMNKLINEMATGIAGSAEKLNTVKAQLAGLVDQGKLAISMTDKMQREVEQAIRYNNTLAEQSEAALWKSEKWKLIEQLKSENTQNLLKEQEKWKEKIAKDKQARQMMQDNLQLRKAININVIRLKNQLLNAKNNKYIPENMRGVARMLLDQIVTNDLSGRKISGIERKDLVELQRVLYGIDAQEGKYTEADLSEIGDENLRDLMINALDEIKEGIAFYNASTGKDIIANLQAFHNALDRIAEAVADITGAIYAQREAFINGRKILVEDLAYDVMTDAGNSRFKGERTGSTRRFRDALHKAIVSGNMTPEYFFRNIGNKGMSFIWESYHEAENRNGLELRKAQQFFEETAKKHGFKNWDTDQRITLDLMYGGKVDMTLGQLMSLYATWNREQKLGPQMSQHLTLGGFYVEENLDKGIAGRKRLQERAHRVTEEDMNLVEQILTDEQKAYVNDIVEFMSTDMSKLGNEASMAAYGVKMYKETYYFPFQMWEGVKNRKSNDAGKGASPNQAFHPSFSKTRLHNARNALILGDFTQTAADHVTGMINYATMGLANENMNKVLNQKIAEGQSRLDTTQRNVRAIFKEAYGQEALQYLMTLKTQLEGGAYSVDKTFYDKLISLFRKNAVAGSLSVALQQPLSYIRAATMIKSRYLAMALGREYWKGSYEQLLKHSGVAVIKDMGRFDMNAGQSAREYLMPEGKKGKARAGWDFVVDKVTILPEKMDAWTWTRMWIAVKLEQHAQHPEMDMNSDAFLDMAAVRFNEIMRRTQVYDSTLVKSQHMRSTNPMMKTLTSFMAEPTLTINVLADAARMAIHREKGGMKALGLAGATYILGAILQAAIKGGVGAGRNPDDKKNGMENFLYRFWSNLIGEADPLTLIPGYSDMVEVIKNGKVTDDAYGVIGKLFTALQTGTGLITGSNKNGPYRAVEDSVGQILQLVSGLPAKNMMRDARAMYNWVMGASQENSPYAWRETSGAVIKYQSKDLFWDADNLIGIINDQLGEAGYQVSNKAYYGRIFDAMQSKNKEAEKEIREYLTVGKGVKEDSITSGIKTAAKEKLGAAEADAWMIKNNLMDSSNTLTTQYKKGEISEAEYKKLLKQQNQELTDNDIWFKLDAIQYQKETGSEDSYSGYYYRLKDAINKNSAKDISSSIKLLLNHGITQKKILDYTSNWKQEYLAASSSEKVKIRDAIQKVYKAAGSSAAEADKKINKWK